MKENGRREEYFWELGIGLQRIDLRWEALLGSRYMPRSDGRT